MKRLGVLDIVVRMARLFALAFMLSLACEPTLLSLPSKLYGRCKPANACNCNATSAVDVSLALLCPQKLHVRRQAFDELSDQALQACVRKLHRVSDGCPTGVPNTPSVRRRLTSTAAVAQNVKDSACFFPFRKSATPEPPGTVLANADYVRSTSSIHRRPELQNEVGLRLNNLTAAVIDITLHNLHARTGYTLWVAIVPRAVVGTMGLVMDCTSLYYGPLTTCAGDRVDVPRAGEGLLHRKFLVPLSGMWGSAYFHFLIEQLPRLTLLWNVVIQNPDIYFQVSNTQDFMFQWVALLLGLPSTRFVGGAATADFMLWPVPPGCGRTHPALVRQLRSHVSAIKLDLSAQLDWWILVLQRGDGRRWQNMNAGLDAIHQRWPALRLPGRVRVLEGAHSANVTVSAFARAKVVIAPHGAGLANLIAARLPQVGVLEFVPSSYWNLCYGELAQHLGMHYVGLQINDGAGITVELAEFLNALETINRTVHFLP